MRDQKGPVKILVIDDYPDQARLIKVILEKDDCLIYEANNGISGIELARSIHPDLILLDIMMPVMDGFEVCRHLKDDPLTGEALVVLISALKTEQADQYNGLENNADGFITLPLSNKELREHILAYLQIILSERHFHQNQPYFEDIFETMGDGIGYTTLTGKIIAVNRALESMIGVNRKELLGKNIIPITSRLLSGNQKKIIVPLLSEIIKGKEIRPFCVEINNRVLEVNSKYNSATKRLVGVFRDITELKAANEAVRASENRLRNLYDNMAEGVCLHKMVYNEHGTPVNYRIVGINRRYESIIKLNREEVLGKLATEVYNTKTPPYFEMYSAVVSNQVSNQFEAYYAPMDRYLSISISPWESDGFATLFSDITERKKIEKELILNEERTRILLDLAPDAFFQSDNSGNFILVNNKASELTGYSKEELYQMNMKDLFDPGQLAEKPLQYQQLSQSETLQVEREIVRKDGSLLPVEMSSRAMPDGTYQSFFRDIQERKAAELTIRESEEKFRTLAESSPNAIMIYQDDHWVYTNPAGEQISGYPAAELYRIKFWEFITGETRDMIRDRGRRRLQGDHFTGDYELKIRTRNGSLRWIHLTANSLSYFGKPAGIVSVADITDRKRMEEDLQIALEQAQESDRLKSAFLANMSHEIRTPMNAILGFSDLLGQPENTPEEQAHFTGIIRNAGERLMHIINDIIDLSKLDSKQVRITPAECDIGKIMQATVEAFRESELFKKEPGLRLISDFDWLKHTLITKTDATRLQQILDNLITNAIKYTSKGTITLGVHLLKKDGREFLEFYVSDTGKGIPANKLRIIFERFRQVEEQEYREGAGLGLSISKALVELLGGAISVASEPGKGTTFSFTIPYLPVKTITAPAPVKTASEQPDLRGKYIIVAEDDDDTWLFLTVTLKGTGAELKRATNGKILMEMLKDRMADLILLDINMPVMTGYECITEIRKKQYPVRVIAQTAYAMTEERNRCLALGCDDYLAKPLSKTGLLASIRNILQTT